MGKLNALSVQKIKLKGRYADTGGLYLQVSETGTRSWLFRYQINGRPRQMGLGSLETIGLAEARAKAQECRKHLLEGRDPIEVRAEKQRREIHQAAKNMTFAQCAKAYIDSHCGEWRNPKHLSQWVNTIESYANPIIGALSVDLIDSDLVLRILEPIWASRTETAVRLRGRIEVILDWASARKLRSGENPARWRGHLDKLLPKPSKISPRKHHPALPIDQIGDLVVQLRARPTVGSLALEFLILTASRTGEVLGARWSEINLADKVWTIPRERMKNKRDHRVPLSPRALQILEKMKGISNSDLVFPGRKCGRPLSNMAFLEILRDLGCCGVTHGFRSTFKDWASERTLFPNEVTEMALAHTLTNKVEAAYRRGDLFLKRTLLMIEWEKFCNRAGETLLADVLAFTN